MFCEFKSASQYDLEQHIEKYHSGKTVEERKTFECTYDNCKRKFTSKSNRTNHIRTAHEGQRFVCGEIDLAGPDFEEWSKADGCGDKFMAKARLEDHVRYVHLGHIRPKTSVAVPVQQPGSLLNDISGVARLAKPTVSCPHCIEVFTRYADLDVHMAKHTSAANNDDEYSAMGREPLPESTMFEDEFVSTWPEGMPQEEIFASSMDYGPPDDGWAEDEANILLLARDSPDRDANIDPSLNMI
jgi:hypothetical protein